jgi:nitrite reductase/ring-hydroxylating ferredoxin subunit
VSAWRLCPAEEIGEGEGRGFRFGSGPDFRALFVIRKRGELRAFENSCPHIGTPLDLMPDRFFARDGEHLLCSTHGARFRWQDGVCIDGPCLGKRLRALALAIEDGALIVETI